MKMKSKAVYTQNLEPFAYVTNSKWRNRSLSF